MASRVQGWLLSLMLWVLSLLLVFQYQRTPEQIKAVSRLFDMTCILPLLVLVLLLHCACRHQAPACVALCEPVLPHGT
jgi:uncharacterized membrane protein YhdT